MIPTCTAAEVAAVLAQIPSLPNAKAERIAERLDRKLRAAALSGKTTSALHVPRLLTQGNALGKTTAGLVVRAAPPSLAVSAGVPRLVAELALGAR